MVVIVCGWCGGHTPPGRCAVCSHEDAARPWVQRGAEPPEVAAAPGRHPMSVADARRRLGALGPGATDEQIAEHHDVDPRTVRRWRAKVSG